MSKSFASITLLLVLMSANPAHARLKYYQYDGNLPFIEMMLNMMTVMGILEKVPVNYMHDIANSRYNDNYPGVTAMQPNINVFPGVSPIIRPGIAPPYNRRYTAWPRGGTNNSSRNCRSILCGNQAQLLNGLWVAENGEMLGIKNHKFLWNDGDQQYLTGKLQVKNGVMVTYLDQVNTRIKYKLKIKNNKLMMKDQNGLVKRFKRVKFSGQRFN